MISENLMDNPRGILIHGFGRERDSDDIPATY